MPATRAPRWRMIGGSGCVGPAVTRAVVALRLVAGSRIRNVRAVRLAVLVDVDELATGITAAPVCSVIALALVDAAAAGVMNVAAVRDIDVDETDAEFAGDSLVAAVTAPAVVDTDADTFGAISARAVI